MFSEINEEDTEHPYRRMRMPTTPKQFSSLQERSTNRGASVCIFLSSQSSVIVLPMQANVATGASGLTITEHNAVHHWTDTFLWTHGEVYSLMIQSSCFATPRPQEDSTESDWQFPKRLHALREVSRSFHFQSPVPLRRRQGMEVSRPTSDKIWCNFTHWRAQKSWVESAE